MTYEEYINNINAYEASKQKHKGYNPTISSYFEYLKNRRNLLKDESFNWTKDLKKAIRKRDQLFFDEQLGNEELTPELQLKLSAVAKGPELYKYVAGTLGHSNLRIYPVTNMNAPVLAPCPTCPHGTRTVYLNKLESNHDYSWVPGEKGHYEKLNTSKSSIPVVNLYEAMEWNLEELPYNNYSEYNKLYGKTLEDYNTDVAGVQQRAWDTYKVFPVQKDNLSEKQLLSMPTSNVSYVKDFHDKLLNTRGERIFYKNGLIFIENNFAPIDYDGFIANVTTSGKLPTLYTE